MEKSPTFSGKTPTFFKKSPTFFLERRRYYPQSEKPDIGRRGVKVVKAKSAKSQGRRARHTRVRKTPYEGVKNWNESDLPFHPTKFGRKYASHGAKSTTFAK